MATIYHYATKRVIFKDNNPAVQDTLKSAVASGVDLRGAHLKDMVFHGVLEGVDLSNSYLERCRLYGRASGCNFSGSTLRSTDLSTFRAFQCDFRETTWLNSSWRLGHLDARSSLANSQAQKSNFTGNELQTQQLENCQWDEQSRQTLSSKVLLLAPLSVKDNLNDQLIALTGDGWTAYHFESVPAADSLRPQGVLRHKQTGALVYIPSAGMGGSGHAYDELRTLLHCAKADSSTSAIMDRSVHFLTQTGLLKEGKLTELGQAVLDSAQKQLNLTPLPPALILEQPEPQASSHYTPGNRR